jgi:hypothetical protein
MNGILSRERIIAPPGYNRWRVPVASIAIRLCIGSVYAWRTAGVLGPLAITSLRQNSVNHAIHDLMANIDPGVFLTKFGAPVDQPQILVEQKTVTISRLMEIAPPGTTDPTSGLYNSTMILMAVLLAIALVSNAFMRPVHTGHHLAAEQ